MWGNFQDLFIFTQRARCSITRTLKNYRFLKDLHWNIFHTKTATITWHMYRTWFAYTTLQICFWLLLSLTFLNPKKPLPYYYLWTCSLLHEHCPCTEADSEMTRNEKQHYILSLPTPPTKESLRAHHNSAKLHQIGRHITRLDWQYLEIYGR